MSQKPAKRATLKDVAAKAGVDVSVVSRVLRRDKRLHIRKETRQRILEVAQALDYQPNVVARSLRTSRTYALGIIVPSLENPVHAQIMAGAEAGASARGYTLLIIHNPGDTDTKLYDKFIQQHRVDGILVTTLPDEATQLKALNELSAPYVLVNRKARGARNWAVIDDRRAAECAVNYLLDRGHKRIAHLSGNLKRYNSRERYAGYRAAIEKAGLPFDESLVAEAGYTVAEGRQAMHCLMERAEGQFTAVFAVTLLAAAGAMSALHEYDRRVSDDVSIVGFHDGEIAEVVYPALTTVRVPLFQMGEKAAHGLIDIIEGRRQRLKTTLTDMEMAERNSVRTIA